MREQDLVSRYPSVYHMAELGSWPNIQRLGLLSTKALLDCFDVEPARRRQLEREWRSNSTTIRNSRFGTATLRDQGPMSPQNIGPLLDGVSVPDWYEFINGKTFFWADQGGLRKMLNAVRYKNRVHSVLTVDMRELVMRHGTRLRLTDQNSGSAISGRRRGLGIFKTIPEFAGYYVREAAVDYSVPDISEFTIRVQNMKSDNVVETIWER